VGADGGSAGGGGGVVFATFLLQAVSRKAEANNVMQVSRLILFRVINSSEVVVEDPAA
jgi:hypothetical protein